MNGEVYYAIFSNGGYLSSAKWEDLPKSNNVILYLKRIIYNEYKSSIAVYRYYKYIIIDEHLSATTFKIGDFQITNICEIGNWSNFDHTTINIEDCKIGSLHEYRSYHRQLDELYLEISSFLRELNSLGSWGDYELTAQISAFNMAVDRSEADITSQISTQSK